MVKNPEIQVSVNLTGNSPMLTVYVNGTQAPCILDTGSTFTLIPYVLWKKLNINQNKLNSSIIYNINSASHKNPIAVLGSFELN